MNLYDFWVSLKEDEKIIFAKNSGLSVSYINTHVVHRRKVPPLKTLYQMAKVSNGALTYHGLCDFFIEETP